MEPRGLQIAIYTSLAVIISIVLGFTFWAYSPMKSTQDAKEYLKSSYNVEVVQRKHVYFIPQNFGKNKFADIGIIFYPGGHVESLAYAPLGYKLAENGVFSVIVSVPLNFAIFDTNAAFDVISKFPNMKWFVAGHSLGGVAACEFAQSNQESIAGVILLASYPSRDLSNSHLNVLSIYSSEDGILPLKKLEEKKKFLPANTKYVEIFGGNHSQFGYYGFQNGDNLAKITPEQQLSLIVKLILEFLEEQIQKDQTNN
ncbi:alpha/beta hydrolase [Fervidobacterium sp.]